jgi:sec-independent protein translocase protein TatB
MFDIGFSEILVIAVVALIVIGPERLPKVARTLGHLFGRMQRYVNDVKSDISREMELDELKKLQTGIQDAAHSFEQSVHQEINTTESQLSGIAASAAVSDELAVTAPAPLPESTTASGSAAPAPADASEQQSATPQLELGLDTPPPARKQA